MSGISDRAIKTQYAQNKYRYNGKDLQNQEFNDGSGLEQYDYGARYFDQQLGRFFTIDQFSEKYYGVSPFQYAANNPINGMDLNGDSIWVNSGGQNYYFGNTKDGGYGFYGSDGNKYSGDDNFVYTLGTDLTGFANTNDQEVQGRLNTMMSSSFKLEVQNGDCEGCGQDRLGSVIMKDGSTKSVDDAGFNIKDPNVVGAVITWDPSTRNTGDNVKNPAGADADLDLAHELLGHGFQATVRQLDKNDDAYVPGDGHFPKIENDAQNISNKVATATGRNDMIRTTYTIPRIVDGENRRIHYHIDPKQAIQWDKNKKY